LVRIREGLASGVQMVGTHRKPIRHVVPLFVENAPVLVTVYRPIDEMEDEWECFGERVVIHVRGIRGRVDCFHDGIHTSI
jgi:hypothetical protein